MRFSSGVKRMSLKPHNEGFNIINKQYDVLLKLLHENSNHNELLLHHILQDCM